MVLVEISSWVLYGMLLLLFYLAYDCSRLYKKNRKFRNILVNMERTGEATINGIGCEEYGQGWDDCLSNIQNDLKRKHTGNKSKEKENGST